FSPVRTMVRPTHKPDVVNDELLATVKRLAPALPHVAELFGIEVPPNAPMPKPLRVNPRQKAGAKGDGKQTAKQTAQRKPKPAAAEGRAAEDRDEATSATAATEPEQAAPEQADTAPPDGGDVTAEPGEATA